MSSRRKYQGTIFIFFVLYASRLSSSTFSPQVFQNLIIPKGVFSVKVNVDWLQCINNCVNSAECISYNFKTGNTRSLCELSRCALPANGECSKSLLRYSHGFVHQQLKISPRVRAFGLLNFLVLYFQLLKILLIHYSAFNPLILIIGGTYLFKITFCGTCFLLIYRFYYHHRDKQKMCFIFPLEYFFFIS